MAESRSSGSDVRIFVNYRTEDEPFGAVFVDHELSARFGSAKVFRASKSIPLGDDFEEVILAAVRRSAALLVLIGPRWLTAADNGVRRLDKPDDWVRQEIAEALRHQVRVIPILLNTDLPRSEDLPDDIAELARRQYLRIHHRNSRRDVMRLSDELTELIPELVPRRRRRILVLGLLAVLLTALGVAASYVIASSGSQSPAAPLRQDRLTLHAEDGAALDDGTTGTRIPVRDLYFPQAAPPNLVIAPEDNAVIAAVTGEPGSADCAAALHARQEGYVAVTPGAWICVMTNRGNLAALRILDVSSTPQQVTISVTVWTTHQ
jgi:hypothetical protein